MPPLQDAEGSDENPLKVEVTVHHAPCRLAVQLSPAPASAQVQHSSLRAELGSELAACAASCCPLVREAFNAESLTVDLGTGLKLACFAS